MPRVWAWREEVTPNKLVTVGLKEAEPAAAWNRQGLQSSLTWSSAISASCSPFLSDDYISDDYGGGMTLVVITNAVSQLGLLQALP